MLRKENLMDPRFEQVVNSFHDLYYNGLPGEGPIFVRTSWMNVPCWKCPLDTWIYQEIMAEIRPDLIVETGTAFGGSALFMAHMMDILGKGEIITIDIEHKENRPVHHPKSRWREVREMLELFNQSRRICRISDGLRTLRGGVESYRLTILLSNDASSFRVRALACVPPRFAVGKEQTEVFTLNEGKKFKG